MLYLLWCSRYDDVYYSALRHLGSLSLFFHCTAKWCGRPGIGLKRLVRPRTLVLAHTHIWRYGLSHRVSFKRFLRLTDKRCPWFGWQALISTVGLTCIYSFLGLLLEEVPVLHHHIKYQRYVLLINDLIVTVSSYRKAVSSVFLFLNCLITAIVCPPTPKDCKPHVWNCFTCWHLDHTHLNREDVTCYISYSHCYSELIRYSYTISKTFILWLSMTHVREDYPWLSLVCAYSLSRPQQVIVCYVIFVMVLTLVTGWIWEFVYIDKGFWKRGG